MSRFIVMISTVLSTIFIPIFGQSSFSLKLQFVYPDGRVIPLEGIEVSLESMDNITLSRSERTDCDGECAFSNVNLGPKEGMIKVKGIKPGPSRKEILKRDVSIRELTTGTSMKLDIKINAKEAESLRCREIDTDRHPREIYRQQLREKEDTIIMLRRMLRATSTEKNELEDKLEDVQIRLEQLRDQFEENEVLIGQFENQVEELKQQIDDLKQQVEEHYRRDIEILRINSSLQIDFFSNYLRTKRATSIEKILRIEGKYLHEYPDRFKIPDWPGKYHLDVYVIQKTDDPYSPYIFFKFEEYISLTYGETNPSFPIDEWRSFLNGLPAYPLVAIGCELRFGPKNDLICRQYFDVKSHKSQQQLELNFARSTCTGN